MSTEPTLEELRASFEQLQRLKAYRQRYAQRLDVKERNREKQRNYYENNREKVLQKRKAVYDANPEKYRERQLVYNYIRKEQERENSQS